jgi:hypothetical protein
LEKTTDISASSLVTISALLHRITECISQRAKILFNVDIPMCFVIDIIVKVGT